MDVKKYLVVAVVAAVTVAVLNRVGSTRKLIGTDQVAKA